MKNRVPTFLALAATTVTQIPASQACTDFTLKTLDGTVVSARSMEWGADLQSRLAIHARDEQRVSKAPDGKPGLKWVAKQGFVGADVSGLDAIVDGVNEKGLSYSLLWFPEYTKYPPIEIGQEAKVVDVTDLGAYLLGTCTTVDEAKAALSKISIGATNVASFGGIPTAHVALHDAHGNNAVVEWVNGKQVISENPNGVLTNSPSFDWHLINLKNYIRVDALNPEPVKIRGTILGSPGQGGGFLGIPGDWTPPSRFVRTTAMLRFAKPAPDVSSGINLAAHIMNAVDIPKGDVRDVVGGQEFTDYTQWILIKNLKNPAIYFRSYDNLSLRKVDLSKINFSAGRAPQFIPVAGGADYSEITPSGN